MALTIKRGDTYPPFVMTLESTNNAGVISPVDLSTAESIRIIIKTGTMALVFSDVDVIDAEEGTISYDWESGDTDYSGIYQVEVEVEWPEGFQTFPNSGFNTMTITPDLGGIA